MEDDQHDRIAEAAPAPEPISSAVPRFRDYAPMWLKKRSRTLHPGTVMDYEGLLRNHLIPFWGDLRLDEIRPLKIRAWVDDVLVAPGALSHRTVHNIYGLLRNIMSEAVADELLSGTPCVLKGHQLPPNENMDPDFGEKHVFSREEMLRIIDHPDIPIRWTALYRTLFAAGPRIGEVLALTWADVDFDGDVPLVKFSKSYSSKVDKVGQTKTKTVKRVPMHPRLEDALYTWWSKYWEVIGEPPEGDRLVFPAPRGKSTRKHMRSSVVYHVFQQQLIALGMPPRRVHDARRTFVTIASNTDGVIIDTIKKVTHPSPGDVHGSYREIPPAVLQREILKIDLGNGEPE